MQGTPRKFLSVLLPQLINTQLAAASVHSGRSIAAFATYTSRATKPSSFNPSPDDLPLEIHRRHKMTDVKSMARGHDGRIEEAFAKCKERGEAAFVTFITAGFPVKEGESRKLRSESGVHGCCVNGGVPGANFGSGRRVKFVTRRSWWGRDAYPLLTIFRHVVDLALRRPWRSPKAFSCHAD